MKGIDILLASFNSFANFDPLKYFSLKANVGLQ